MIDLERQGAMDGNQEASLGCLKNKEFPCDLHDSGNSIEVYPEPKVEINAKPGGILDPDSSLHRENSVPPNGAYHRPFYQPEHCMWSAFYPDLQKVQQAQWNSFESHFYTMYREFHIPVDNRLQCAPLKMFSPRYPQDFQFQEFQYFVVIDFEATCDKEKNPHPQEIIEFPSVVVNSVTGQVEASFQIYVKPIYHQLLTDFCKELTGIQQIQVDRGVPLGEALLIHDKWLEDKGIKHTNFAIVTWSNWDCRVMLESECRFKRIRKPPYFNRWINLKVAFQEVFGGVRCNLKEAVQLSGLSWEGRPHCGLDDALNTGRLLSQLMRRGFKFSITNSLMWQSVDCPLAWQQLPDYPPPSPILQPPKPKQLVGPTSHFLPLSDPNFKERSTYCHCGVMSSKGKVRKPGPKHGRWFFGCGNWTVTRGALCAYFEWAS